VFNFNKLTKSGLVPLFFYICFILFIGVSSARQGLSHYYADAAIRSGSDADAASAISFQPNNPKARKTLGIIFLRRRDYAAAADAFDNAAANQQNDYLTWLRLGYSRYKLGQFDEAEQAYRIAVFLAPNYDQPNYYLGKMLLDTGRPGQAFPYLSKAAEHDMALYPEILHHARKTYPDDPAAIQNAAMLETTDANKIFARYLIKHSFMTPKVKAFLVGDQLTAAEKDGFVGYLIRRRNYEVAREVWLSRFADKNVDSNALIFDGGFENITESDVSGFGWQIDQRVSETAVARVEKEARSGAHSLQIKFAGDVELQRAILSQLIYVQPNRKYELKYSYRSENLVSAGLPALVISHGRSGTILAESVIQRTPNGKWVDSTISFVTDALPVVRIGLQRVSCNTSPCPIFGGIYLDDFAVRER